MKTLEQVEQLKAQWKKDPCWDIENTEGFEEYREELLAYHKAQGAIWVEENRQHHEFLTSLLCPMSFSNSNENADCHCRAEKCAWWIEDKDICAITALVLESDED